MGRSGEVRIARTSADAQTCVLYNIADGGKLFVLRDGKLVRAIPTAAEDLGLSADGGLIAVVTENLLKLYSVADGLQWIFHGDDLLHSPRFSGDGRLAVASNLGTVYVTDLDGRVRAGEGHAGPGRARLAGRRQPAAGHLGRGSVPARQATMSRSGKPV